MNKKNLTLEEKVDLILAYQKKQKTYGFMRVLLLWLIFFTLLILPVLGMMWVGSFLEEMGLEPKKVKQTIEKIEILTEQIPASLFQP